MEQRAQLYFLCPDDENRIAYEKHLLSLDISAEFFKESDTFISKAQNLQPLGIVVDQKCLLGSSDKLKHFLSAADSVLPLLKVVRNKGTQEISAIVGTQNLSGPVLFKEFVENYCKRFNARVFRRETRFPRILDLYLADPETGKNMFPGVSVNISKHGMFVLTFDDWSTSENVLVDIIDSKNSIQRIESKICWKKPFTQTSGSFPGIGLYFERDYPDYLKEYF
ncbi:MAG: PilZ domain-containing protein [Proteobacteria bacterium]|nr:PilZ domain-containing protein [Pseudomonadota bacterium]